MRPDHGDASRFADDLAADERVLWIGKSGFSPASQPVATLFCLLLTAYLFMTTWMTGSMSDFCNGRGVSTCGSYYLLVPPLMLLLSLSAAFDWLERRIAKRGRATIEIVLTDRRSIRITDWPWRRVRSRSYIENARRIGLAGLVMQGRNYGFALAPVDAAQIMGLMSSRRKATP